MIDPDDSFAVARDMIGERKSVGQDEQAAEPEDLAAKHFSETGVSMPAKPIAAKHGSKARPAQ